jgi:RNA polymerase sigma-32 factor
MNNDILLLNKNEGFLSKINTERSQISEYIKKVNKFPILTEQQEKKLLEDFFLNQNSQAGHLVLNSHLRLVIKIAMQYRKFHSSMLDLIAEGNLGLLKALKNFSLEKEVRFSTYAILWVKASIQNFLTKTLTSIKAITTTTQKKLLFKLGKAKQFLGIKDGSTSREDAKKIANFLNVEENEILKHEKMIYAIKENSINDLILSEESEGAEVGDFLSSQEHTLEENAIITNEKNILKEKIANALSKLSKREAEIIRLRILNPEKYTLAELSSKFKISKERIRQIQENSLKKLKELLKEEEKQINF